MNRFIAGALGGLLATVPMTAVMTRFFEKLPLSQQYPLPPREIIEVAVNRLPLRTELNDRQLTELSLKAHYAYGALTGALYPLLIRSTRRPVLLGGGYGVAIWAASYLGWLPATNLLKPATLHPWRRNLLMIFAHWVWGAGTVIIGQALRPRKS